MRNYLEFGNLEITERRHMDHNLQYYVDTHCSLFRTDKPNKKYDPRLENSCRMFSSLLPQELTSKTGVYALLAYFLRGDGHKGEQLV